VIPEKQAEDVLAPIAPFKVYNRNDLNIKFEVLPISKLSQEMFQWVLKLLKANMVALFVVTASPPPPPPPLCWPLYLTNCVYAVHDLPQIGTIQLGDGAIAVSEVS
jgi:hypothetical protein